MEKKDVEIVVEAKKKSKLVGNNRYPIDKVIRLAIDVEQAVKYKMMGLEYKDIYKLVVTGRRKFCSIAFKRVVDRYTPADYRGSDIAKKRKAEAKIELLNRKHDKLLNNITDEKMDEASVKDLSLASKHIHEQLRLEEGKSTSNSSIISFAQVIEGTVGEDGL